MHLISHRGNTEGKTEHENNPDNILYTLNFFECEVDVWYMNGWWLGHDKPQYVIEEDFLRLEGLWCHAKTIQTLYELMRLGVHCFFHAEDDATLTSRGFIWTYPQKELTPRSICVLPEISEGVLSKRPKCAGVCSDYISKYK